MPTEINIHALGFQSTVPFEQIAAYLSPLPGIHVEGQEFTYQDEEAGIFFIIMPSHLEPEGGEKRLHPGPDSDGQCSNILVRVPDEVTPPLREPLADFCFNLARHLKWQVYAAGTDVPFTDEADLVRRLGGDTEPPRAAGGCVTVLSLLAVGALLLTVLLR